MCYHAFVQSVLTFSFICWYKTINLKSKKPLDNIVNLCSKIVGRKQVPLEQLFTKRALSKADSIIKDSSHPLSCLFEALPSNQRFRTIRARTRRYQNTFVPQAISLFNQKLSRSSTRQACRGVSVHHGLAAQLFD